VRVKLQTSSGKRIYVELKRKPLLPGRVFKNIYTKKCKEMCAKKKMFSSREEFSFGLKTVFFSCGLFGVLYIHSRTRFSPTQTHLQTHTRVRVFSSGSFFISYFSFSVFFIFSVIRWRFRIQIIKSFSVWELGKCMFGTYHRLVNKL